MRHMIEHSIGIAPTWPRRYESRHLVWRRRRANRWGSCAGTTRCDERCDAPKRGGDLRESGHFAYLLAARSLRRRGNPIFTLLIRIPAYGARGAPLTIAIEYREGTMVF